MNDTTQPQEKTLLQKVASPQQAPPATLILESQPQATPAPELDLRPAESTSMHDEDAIPDALPQPDSPSVVVDISDDTTPPEQLWPDNQLGLTQYANDPLGLNQASPDMHPAEVSPAPIVRAAEAAAASTPMKPADVPMSLVDDMKAMHISTPQPKPKPSPKRTIDEPLKFTHITSDAVKVWTTLLRRQTNQHAKSDAPTPAAAPVAPAATPPTATPAPPKAVEAAAPAADDVEMKDGEILVQVDAGDDKKDTRAAYMRYYRSVRSPKVPAAVAVKFRQACQDKTGKLAAELFAAYMESGENWLSSSIVMEESQAHNETEGGRWGWMTKEETQFILN